MNVECMTPVIKSFNTGVMHGDTEGHYSCIYHMEHIMVCILFHAPCMHACKNCHGILTRKLANGVGGR